MPKVTLITPCFNAEKHLQQTLESIQAQTMGDYEHICVDDGSTDGTPRMLEAYAERDPRVRVLRGANAGAGAARNRALEQATGTWVYCIDADDIMEPTLLEEAIARGEEEKAQVVIFRCDLLDSQTGQVTPFDYCFDTSWLDPKAHSFNPVAHPDRILNSFQNWVHNKLFLREFLQDNSIAFSNIHRTEELMFTGRALTEATRIAVLDRSLHQYRTNNLESSIENSDSYYLDFLTAFTVFRRHLEESGLWDLYGESYVNWAIEAVGGNLLRSKRKETFWNIVRAMRDGGLERLGIVGYPAERAYNRRQWEVCNALLNCTDDELPLVLMHALVRENEIVAAATSVEAKRYREARDKVYELEDQIAVLWQYNEDMRNSISFKLGRVLTSPLRLVHRRKE